MGCETIDTGAEYALYWLACNRPDVIADAMRFQPSMLAERRWERGEVARLLEAHTVVAASEGDDR